MYQFTSESVSIGHPDKVADLISDAVATYLIDKNVNHRAAVETLVTTNMVTLAGEYKSNKFDKDIKPLVEHTATDSKEEHWQKFIEQVNAGDVYRQESFADTFSELYDILKGDMVSI